MFARMPFEQWKFALGKIEDFIFCKSGSSVMMRYLVDVAKGCFSNESVKRLLPKLSDEIMILISDGIGRDIKQTDRQCRTLIWFLECLLGLCRFSEGALISRIETVQGLFTMMASLRQRTCVILTGRIFKAIIRSLSDQYIVAWSREEEIGEASSTATIDTVNPKWQLPDSASMMASQSLYSHFRSLISAMSSEDEDTLRAKLIFSKYLFKATTIMDGGPNRLEESELLTFALEISRNALLAIETRQLALGLLVAGTDYFAYSTQSIQTARFTSYVQIRQFEKFKREKCLPILIQGLFVDQSMIVESCRSGTMLLGSQTMENVSFQISTKPILLIRDQPTLYCSRISWNLKKVPLQFTLISALDWLNQYLQMNCALIHQESQSCQKFFKLKTLLVPRKAASEDYVT